MADETPKDEKTEEATPRRRSEAREKGQVAISTELISAVALSVGLTALLVGGGFIASRVGLLVVQGLDLVGARGRDELDPGAAASLFRQAAEGVVQGVLIVAVPLLLVGLLVGYGQVGFQIAPKAIGFDLARLNPTKGVSRLFSARSSVRTLSALLKVILIGAAMGTVTWLSLADIASMVGNELGPVMTATGSIVLRAAIAGLIVIFALGLFDLAFQRFQHDKDLRMSRKEIKEEHRNSDGDPHVRARIRQVQREMASRRMMADVPTATVVVTNPTHYAVALRYEGAGSAGAAPTVVAKGVDLVAQRIKELAREHGVPCFEDVPLARALHAQVEIGQEIPVDLYAAVASVLAYVYRVRGERVAS